MASFFYNKVRSRLSAAAASDATTLSVQDGSSWPTSYPSDFFCTIRDGEGNVEVVNVTGRTGSSLAVERGAQDTTPLAWDAGVLIQQRTTSGLASLILQGPSYRSNAGSPSGVLTPEFIGEKVFDSDNSDWYSATGTGDTDWKKLT